MGKQITIIFVVLFNCTVAWGQDYVPQFFIIELMAGDPNRSNMNFKNIIEGNFPVEKLKAMIDK